MRVLVCGGRGYEDIEGGGTIVREALSQLFLNPPEKEDVVLISGGAKGADQIPIYMYEGEEDEWGGLEVYPADWKLHGKSAGHIRNQQMLDESKPDIVIAFPGGRGTANMIKRAKKAGVEVFQVDT
jgi:hypothetical protein